MPNPWEVVLLSLATWRVASIISNEDGPGEVFHKIRLWAGETEVNGIRSATTWYGKGLTCLWCLSCYVGLFFFALYLSGEQIWWWIAVPFALSAVAIMIDTWTNRD